jgi:hypothetical protein
MDRDPAHADPNTLAPLVTAASLPTWRQIFTNMAQQGLAYRGTPDNPHLKVISASSTAATLSSCPIADAGDPFVQYHVSTGRVVKAPTGGPYLKAIVVVNADGHWRVSSIATDTANRCEP